MPLAEVKRCKRCSLVKPSVEFNRNRTSRDGLQAYCRPCGNELSRQWNRSHPKQMVENERRYRRRNPERELLQSARQRAKRAGLPFDLTIDDINIPAVCPVLGTPLVKGEGYMSGASPSLDKIVPSRGYVRGNVSVISMRANRLKSDATADELARLWAYVAAT